MDIIAKDLRKRRVEGERAPPVSPTKRSGLATIRGDLGSRDVRDWELQATLGRTADAVCTRPPKQSVRSFTPPPGNLADGISHAYCPGTTSASVELQTWRPLRYYRGTSLIRNSHPPLRH